MRARWSLLALTLLLLAPRALPAQEPIPQTVFERGRVVAITRENMDTTFPDIPRLVQTVTMEILTGPDAGDTFVTENGVLQGRDDMRLRVGEQVVLTKLEKSDGSVTYIIGEKYRLPALGWLVGIFLVLSILLGGWMGLCSLLGLAVSIGILIFFVVPRIVEGQNPLLVSIVGAVMIACSSLILAHGWKRRTLVALLSTIVTLLLSFVTAVVFVHVARLFGMGTEESMFLQFGQLSGVNLRGLLLGGIIIGCLGVLDDITTAQTAAVDEIGRANPALSRKALWIAGMSVGREHIASLINTLALAYVGASLPLLLLFTVQADSPTWVILNSEFLAEEIVRTLVGSITLLFAVPLATGIAVLLLDPSTSHAGQSSHHHH